MKKSLTVLFLFIAAFAFAQSTDYSKIPTGSVSECKTAEPSVITAADLILSKPLNDETSSDARGFIIRWMTSTEYSFTIDNKITDLTKKKANKNLLVIYMACQAKYLLEHKDDAKNNTAIEVGAFTLLADYISDSTHGVSITKEIQKLLDAKKNGKMDDFVNGKL
jgi:hypothetical protein